jgi:hypothetical protein
MTTTPSCPDDIMNQAIAAYLDPLTFWQLHHKIKYLLEQLALARLKDNQTSCMVLSRLLCAGVERLQQQADKDWFERHGEPILDALITPAEEGTL